MSEPTAANDQEQHTTTIEITGNGQINAAFENTEGPEGDPTPQTPTHPTQIQRPNTPPPQAPRPKTPPPQIPTAQPDTTHLNGETPHMNGEAKANGVELRTPGSEDTKEVNEAVNLELVNMQPYSNSIPIKKESTELDIGDPYDEYFVPVNQHKKYMRGEKLYVTHDKRRSLGGSKKKCCWGVLTVIVLGGIVAILLGVIISSQETPAEESRNFNGMKASIGGGIIATPSPSSTAQPPRPTTDMSEMYLNNVLQGELTIDNLEFTPGLANHNSSEFRNLAASLEEELKSALFDHQTLHYGPADITVKVLEFRPGSVIVLYRIGWEFKDGIKNPPDPIDKDGLKVRLQEHLRSHDGFLYNYRLTLHNLKSERVNNLCKIDNGGCNQNCIFDRSNLKIQCTCEESYTLSNDEKTCISSDSSPPEDATITPSSGRENQEHEISPEVHKSPDESYSEHIHTPKTEMPTVIEQSSETVPPVETELPPVHEQSGIKHTFDEFEPPSVQETSSETLSENNTSETYDNVDYQSVKELQSISTSESNIVDLPMTEANSSSERAIVDHGHYVEEQTTELPHEATDMSMGVFSSSVPISESGLSTQSHMNISEQPLEPVTPSLTYSYNNFNTEKGFDMIFETTTVPSVKLQTEESEDPHHWSNEPSELTEFHNEFSSSTVPSTSSERLAKYNQFPPVTGDSTYEPKDGPYYPMETTTMNEELKKEQMLTATEYKTEQPSEDSHLSQASPQTPMESTEVEGEISTEKINPDDSEFKSYDSLVNNHSTAYAITVPSVNEQTNTDVDSKKEEGFTEIVPTTNKFFEIWENMENHSMNLPVDPGPHNSSNEKDEINGLIYVTTMMPLDQSKEVNKNEMFTTYDPKSFHNSSESPDVPSFEMKTEIPSYTYTNRDSLNMSYSGSYSETDVMPMEHTDSENIETVTMPIEITDSKNIETVTMPIENTDSKNIETVTMPIENNDSKNIETVTMPMENTGSKNIETVTMPIEHTDSKNIKMVTMPIEHTDSKNTEMVTMPIEHLLINNTEVEIVPTDQTVNKKEEIQTETTEHTFTEFHPSSEPNSPTMTPSSLSSTMELMMMTAQSSSSSVMDLMTTASSPSSSMDSMTMTTSSSPSSSEDISDTILKNISHSSSIHENMEEMYVTTTEMITSDTLSHMVNNKTHESETNAPVTESIRSSSLQYENIVVNEEPKIPLSENSDPMVPTFLVGGENMPSIALTPNPDLSGPYSVDSTIQPITEEDETEFIRPTETIISGVSTDAQADHSNHWYDSKNALNSLDDDYNEEEKYANYKLVKGKPEHITKGYKSIKIEENIRIPQDNDAVEQTHNQQIEQVPISEKNENNSSTNLPTTESYESVTIPSHDENISSNIKEEEKLLIKEVHMIPTEATATLSPNVDSEHSTEQQPEKNDHNTMELSENPEKLSLNSSEPTEQTKSMEYAEEKSEPRGMNFTLHSSTDDINTNPQSEKINFTDVNPTTASSSLLSGGTTFEESIQMSTIQYDEMNNSPSMAIQCDTDQFACHDRSRCLMKLQQCDGIKDCGDGSDEEDCDKLNCGENFKCNDGTCLSKHMVCNGFQNCPDGGDEENCGSGEMSKMGHNEQIFEQSNFTETTDAESPERKVVTLQTDLAEPLSSSISSTEPPLTTMEGDDHGTLVLSSIAKMEEVSSNGNELPSSSIETINNSTSESTTMPAIEEDASGSLESNVTSVETPSNSTLSPSSMPIVEEVSSSSHEAPSSSVEPVNDISVTASMATDEGVSSSTMATMEEVSSSSHESVAISAEAFNTSTLASTSIAPIEEVLNTTHDALSNTTESSISSNTELLANISGEEIVSSSAESELNNSMEHIINTTQHSEATNNVGTPNTEASDLVITTMQTESKVTESASSSTDNALGSMESTSSTTESPSSSMESISNTAMPLH